MRTVNRIEDTLKELGYPQLSYSVQPVPHKTDLMELCHKFDEHPLLSVFKAFLHDASWQVALSQLTGATGEPHELSHLKKEIQALKKRLDAYDEMFEKERELDKQIETEIKAMETEPVNLIDYKPEDWLPTGEELDELMEDD